MRYEDALPLFKIIANPIAGIIAAFLVWFILWIKKRYSTLKASLSALIILALFISYYHIKDITTWWIVSLAIAAGWLLLLFVDLRYRVSIFNYYFAFSGAIVLLLSGL